MLNHLFELVRSNAKDTSYNTDTVDKCNTRYCAIILLVLATFVITNQLVGDVIDCWTEAQYNGQWVKYTDQMCWVSNTYHLPDDISPEVGRGTPHMYEIKYYQWVPIILAMQSLLFFLPSLLWSAVADSSIDISNIVSALSEKAHVINPEARDKAVKNLSLQFHRYIKNRRQYSKTNLSEVRRKLKETNSFCLACGSRYGNYLGLFYLITKMLFVFNAWAQLFCLDTFLGPKFHAYGFDVVQSMYNGVDWTNSKRFPRVTLCDFTVRKMGTVQPVTVQCVLSINLFNERIFLFVWFLLLSMALINTSNFVLWMWRIILRKNRYEYIRKHLTLMDKLDSSKNLNLLRPFVDRYLAHDGVFVIRLMSKNTTSLVVSEMIAALFDNFSEYKEQAKDDEFSSISPKSSSFGLNSRKSSLHKYNSRKPSMPPSYFSGLRQHFSMGNGKLPDGLMDDLDDDHSGGSSEAGGVRYPNSRNDVIFRPEELASLRRLLAQHERGLANAAHTGAHSISVGGARAVQPTAPPVSSVVANNYSAAPTISTGAYPQFPIDDAAFDPESHPKAREALMTNTDI